MAVIEPAKSGRASCRSCKEKIEKNAARLGIETEMTRGDNTFTSTKWYHLECGIKDFPDQIVLARIDGPISEEEQEKIQKVKKEFNRAGVSIQDISKVDKPDITVNIEARVLRVMATRQGTTPDGETLDMTTVYVEGEDGRSKIILWGENATISANKQSRIVVLDGRSELAANDQIQVNAFSESVVLIDPTDEDLDEHMESVELFISQAWNRPTGMPVEFSYAPSGRASCAICEEKIQKGELKVVKPEFIEANNRRFPGNISMHLHCAIKDEYGDEVLHEAITRMPPTLIEENQEILKELMNGLPDIPAKQILEKLL
jgi:hypothetical protein